MYNVGVFPGKFFPPHRGHLSSIIRAATMTNKLYVVVSDNMEIAKEWCKKHDIQIDYYNENIPEIRSMDFGKDKIVADIYLDDKAMNIDVIEVTD